MTERKNPCDSGAAIIKELAKDVEHYSITVENGGVGIFDDILPNRNTYAGKKTQLEEGLRNSFGIDISLPNGAENGEKREEKISLPRNPKLFAEVIDILCEYNFDIINVDVNRNYFTARNNMRNF